MPSVKFPANTAQYGGNHPCVRTNNKYRELEIGDVGRGHKQYCSRLTSDAFSVETNNFDTSKQAIFLKQSAVLPR